MTALPPAAAPEPPEGPDVSPAEGAAAPGPAGPPGPPDSEVRRAVRAARDAGLGYGLAATRATLRAAVGLGRAGTDVALKVLDQGPVGAAAATVADRLEPAAAAGRRHREATAAEVDALIATVADEVVRRLDVDGIISQVDVDDIVRRVDVDDIIRRVDIDDILVRVDIDGIVRRTEVGTLIVQSTGGVVTTFLDFVRSLGVSLDTVATRIADRIVRKGRPRPVAPVLLAGGPAPDAEVVTPSQVLPPAAGR